MCGVTGCGRIALTRKTFRRGGTRTKWEAAEEAPDRGEGGGHEKNRKVYQLASIDVMELSKIELNRARIASINRWKRGQN